MANIALRTTTAGQVVGMADPRQSIKYTHIAAAALNAGDAVYINTSGMVDKASAGAAGTKQFRGIALETCGAGQGVGVLYDGPIEGYAIDALAFDAVVYLSDTAGSLGDAAGSSSVTVGRVMACANTDSAGTIRKILYIHSRQEANW